MNWAFPLLAVVLAYAIGSLSFAVIISRCMGLNDPRSYGSGNPGATNVLRSGNKKAAILTLLSDALKGFFPVLAVVLLQERLGWNPAVAAWVALAAFLGHLWPVFFNFQGGKGVATAAGVLLALEPLLGAGVLATWLLVAYATRYSSLAAIVAALSVPFYQLLFWGPSATTLALVPMSLLLIWRHEGNIRKLLAGKESKIGQKASGASASSATTSAEPASHHAQYVQHQKAHKTPHAHSKSPKSHHPKGKH